MKKRSLSISMILATTLLSGFYTYNVSANSSSVCQQTQNCQDKISMAFLCSSDICGNYSGTACVICVDPV